jgi:hypothetical protein
MRASSRKDKKQIVKRETKQKENAVAMRLESHQFWHIAHKTASQRDSGKCCRTLVAKWREPLPLPRAPSPLRLESARSMSAILMPALAAVRPLRLHQVFLTPRSATSAPVVLASAAAASSSSEFTTSAAAPVVERWSIMA